MKKKYTTVLAALVLLTSLNLAQALSSINLTTFGSDVSSFGWAWNTATSTVSGSDAEGAAIAPNDFSPVNLTLLDNYGSNPANLRLVLTGLVTTSPGGAFTITLEDSLSNLSATPFTWSSYTTTSSSVTVPVTITAGFLWNNIVGWTLDAGGTGNAVNATFTSLDATAVPEPSTYALLAMCGLALGGYVIRRRRRA